MRTKSHSTVVLCIYGCLALLQFSLSVSLSSNDIKVEKVTTKYRKTCFSSSSAAASTLNSLTIAPMNLKFVYM